MNVRLRYLFLDADGVLNNRQWITNGNPAMRQQPAGAACAMDPANVACLNELVESVQPVIVLTTTWRIGQNPFTRFMEGLVQSGYTGKKPVRSTPDLSSPMHSSRLIRAASRGDEIRQWLADNIPVGYERSIRFAILDDSADAWPVRGRENEGLFVQTDSSVGLTREHVQHACEWLAMVAEEVEPLC